MENTGPFKSHGVHQKTICNCSCQAVTHPGTSEPNKLFFLLLQPIAGNSTDNRVILNAIIVSFNGHGIGSAVLREEHVDTCT
jgi:hypothetical protein